VSSQRAEAGAGELSDEEIRKIEEAVRSSIDLSGSVSSLKDLHETTARMIREALDTETILAFTVPEISLDTTDLFSCLQDMEQQILAMQESAGNMGETAGQLKQLQSSLSALQSAVRQLSDGSNALSEGLSAYGDGVSALASGASQLRSGMREFSKAGSSLAGGYGAITEGLKAFSEGIDEFDREGVQRLAGLAGEDLAEVLRRLKAIRTADRSYRSFSGIFPEQEGSVRIILETDSIGE
jgi:X-X-X-Leu-X-X-Gly heptad repeat protein